MREAPVCDALKARILGKGGGRRAEMPPPNSLRAQLLPTVQNFASDLNKTRNQLYAIAHLLEKFKSSLHRSAAVHSTVCCCSPTGKGVTYLQNRLGGDRRLWL